MDRGSICIGLQTSSAISLSLNLFFITAFTTRPMKFQCPQHKALTYWKREIFNARPYHSFIDGKGKCFEDSFTVFHFWANSFSLEACHFLLETYYFGYSLYISHMCCQKKLGSFLPIENGACLDGEDQNRNTTWPENVLQIRQERPPHNLMKLLQEVVHRTTMSEKDTNSPRKL